MSERHATPRAGHRRPEPTDQRPAAAPGGRAASIPLMGRDTEPTLFDLSVAGRTAASFRTTGVPDWAEEELVPAEFLRAAPLALPNVSERDLTAHFTRLSHRQYAVDLGAYPLGSCTMKYNPKLCDEAAGLPGPDGRSSGRSRLDGAGLVASCSSSSESTLCAITGMAAATLQPPAGASGELTGLLLMRAWHDAHGSGDSRRRVIIPDSAHGTNAGVGHPRRLRGDHGGERRPRLRRRRRPCARSSATTSPASC